MSQKSQQHKHKHKQQGDKQQHQDKYLGNDQHQGTQHQPLNYPNTQSPHDANQQQNTKHQLDDNPHKPQTVKQHQHQDVKQHQNATQDDNQQQYQQQNQDRFKDQLPNDASKEQFPTDSIKGQFDKFAADVGIDSNKRKHIIWFVAVLLFSITVVVIYNMYANQNSHTTTNSYLPSELQGAQQTATKNYATKDNQTNNYTTIDNQADNYANSQTTTGNYLQSEQQPAQQTTKNNHTNNYIIKDRNYSQL